MTQGRPKHLDTEYIETVWRIARRHDTLHLLVYLLRQQARERGDIQTVFLINSTIQRANEGDSIKLDLLALMAERKI